MSDYVIHSEARAGHWVAWVTSAADSKPAGSVILPGQTQEEAESNAQHWIERLTQDSSLLRL
ncbi:uncharacterized protein METZ01_LOCUS431534 [marine metagenome]|uniref:HicB-like antitoxin of toxin-antitoxin system domain-containing protein n=1 Tax=marine metagenome TaxID=408172 RepID=A0A382Y6C2_9ZZZZ